MVGRDPFAPYTGEIGNLHLEGMFLSYSIFFYLFFFIFYFYNHLILFFFLVVRQLSLIKFYLECM